MLYRLVHKVLLFKSLKFKGIYSWADSSIVLPWVKVLPTHWTTLMTNKVAGIQELTTNSIWKHIKSENNPVDYVSRVMSPDILTNKLWWQEPEFLLDTKTTFLMIVALKLQFCQNKEKIF